MSDPERLGHFGREVTADQIITAEFRKTSAFSNAFVALFAKHNPRNLTNGLAIDIGTALSSYNLKEFHHIFPKAYLRSRGVPPQRINSIGNICMLSADQNKAIADKEPRAYFAQVRNKLGGDFEAVLDSNLIPVDAVEFIERNDYESFLDKRANYLARVVNSLM